MKSIQSRAGIVEETTCMVSIGVEMAAVEARVGVVLIECLSLAQVNPRVIFPQPVPILHLCPPRKVHELGGKVNCCYNPKLQINSKPKISLIFLNFLGI
jgi:hypothetical protein